MNNKPSFEKNPDVDRLVSFLQVRSRATYAEMNDLTRRQINGRDRYVLASACRILERRGIIFVPERGIGVVRATNGQVASLSTAHPIKKVQRITRRANKRQEHVNVQALSADERLALYIGRAVLDIVTKNTSKSVRTQLAKEIEKTGGEPLTIHQVTALSRLRKR
jgi:hypothetical protein